MLPQAPLWLSMGLDFSTFSHSLTTEHCISPSTNKTVSVSDNIPTESLLRNNNMLTSEAASVSQWAQQKWLMSELVANLQDFPEIANYAHPLSFSALVRGDPLRIHGKALWFLKLESSR